MNAVRFRYESSDSRLGELWFCSSSSDVYQHRGPECIFERTSSLKEKFSETSSRNCSGAGEAVGTWTLENLRQKFVLLQDQHWT